VLNSVIVVLERRTPFAGGSLETHPYEAGWAGEALFFVQAPAPHPELRIRLQLSPDGINWVDEGGEAVLEEERPIALLRTLQFGTFLRVVVEADEGSEETELLIHLALKG
jgi:hypothetical protein